MIARLVVYAIKIYQEYLSPLKGASCRYVPSCSEYARQAVEKYGLKKGLWLAAKRLARCNPLGGFGYDPLE